MQERRKFKRRFIMYYTRIFDRTTGAVLGYLVDLSANGAMVVSEKFLCPAKFTGCVWMYRKNFPQKLAWILRLSANGAALTRILDSLIRVSS